jgi:hypothetical protein
MIWNGTIMSIRAQLICVIAAGLPLACMKPNPLIYTLGDDDTGMSDESDSGESDSGDSDSGDSDSSEVPLDVQTDQVCTSVAPYEPACGTCLASSCCDLLSACNELDDCSCLAACLLAGGSNGACKQSCDGAQASDIAELSALLDCATDSCAADC